MSPKFRYCGIMSIQLLAQVESPNLLLGIETNLLDVLGRRPDALYGQSLEIFRGPDTDHDQIVSAMKEAGYEKVFNEFEVVLYEPSGQQRTVLISFSPCTRTKGHPVCSILTLNFSREYPRVNEQPMTTAAISENSYVYGKNAATRNIVFDQSIEPWLPEQHSCSRPFLFPNKLHCATTQAAAPNPTLCKTRYARAGSAFQIAA